jgi:hypothetical protein
LAAKPAFQARWWMGSHQMKAAPSHHWDQLKTWVLALDAQERHPLAPRVQM